MNLFFQKYLHVLDGAAQGAMRALREHFEVVKRDASEKEALKARTEVEMKVSVFLVDIPLFSTPARVELKPSPHLKLICLIYYVCRCQDKDLHHLNFIMLHKGSISSLAVNCSIIHVEQNSALAECSSEVCFAL